jgi:hypothetical protein
MGAGSTAKHIEKERKQRMVEDGIKQLSLPTIHCRLSKGLGAFFVALSLLGIAFINGWLSSVSIQSPLVLGIQNSALVMTAIFCSVTPYKPNPIITSQEFICFPSIFFIGKGKYISFKNIRSVEEYVTRGEYGGKRVLQVFLNQGRTFKITELQLQTESSSSLDGFVYVKDYLKSQMLLVRSQAQLQNRSTTETE